MENKHYQYLFGPVASRRLGTSLGIDLVRAKTCSLDCVYCEAGATTAHTLARREYVPTDAVIAELREALSCGPELDYVTFSGAGEPTLHAGIGRIVSSLKREFPQYKLCLLTNALGFGDPELLREIAAVDLCVPSLDASNAEEFEKINRPVKDVPFDDFVRNLIAYTRSATCRIDLELFIVPGVNDSDASIRRFAEIIRQMKVEKVQLNTLDRPAVCGWVRPSGAANTHRFIAALEPFVPVEAVGVFKYKSAALRRDVKLDKLDERIVALVCRRPATIADVVEATGVDQRVAAERLAELLHAGVLSSERLERGDFYSKA